MNSKSKRTLTVGTLAAAVVAVLIPTGCGAAAAPSSPQQPMGAPASQLDVR